MMTYFIASSRRESTDNRFSLAHDLAASMLSYADTVGVHALEHVGVHACGAHACRACICAHVHSMATVTDSERQSHFM